MRFFLVSLFIGLISLPAVFPSSSEAVCRVTATRAEALAQFNQSVDHAFIIYNERVAAVQAAYDRQVLLNGERFQAARNAVGEGTPGSTDALNDAILAYNSAQDLAVATFNSDARSAMQDYTLVTAAAMDAYKRSLCLR